MNWLDKKSACLYLGVSMPTITRYMKSNRLAYYKTSEARTAKVLFKKEDLDEFLKEIKK